MKTETHVINDWRPETKSLLNRLVANGCQLVSGDNGEEQFKFDGDLDAFISNLIACDEAHLYVKSPTKPGRSIWIYIVLGNNPGEMPSDYVVDNTLDKVTQAHYSEWELKGQPLARGYYDAGKWVDAALPVS